MKINWKVRLTNKLWWTQIISAILLVITSAGIELPSWINNEVILAVLSVLTLLGIITDPTTQGVLDSDLAMSKENIKDTSVYEKLNAPVNEEVPEETKDEE